MNNKMKFRTLSLVCLLALFGILIYSISSTENQSSKDNTTFLHEFEEQPEDRVKTNKGRNEYFFKLLRDPSTNAIPSNVRAKELDFFDQLKQESYKSKSIASPFNWTEIGPNDVSGRTFGIGLDRRNSNILIAGGASGGIWKSTNAGNSWTLKSEPTHNLGVSSIVQHPTNQDTWYYSTAEFFGSARARDGGGAFYGSGIYMSTDNGETWAQVPGTEDNDNSFNSQLDFISKIVVSPTTGTIFYASNAFGIFRSVQNGANASLVLGNANDHVYADVEVTSDGTLYAAVSQAFGGVTPTSSSGVYMSTNDGVTWTDITPAGYPSDPDRSVIGVAPSNEDIFYVFTDTGSGADGLSLFRFDVTNFPTVSSSDRSSGIPNFGDEVGEMNPQGSYNMVCKVLPNNPNFVIIGTTNLFRSTDGFSSIPQTDGSGVADASQVDEYWIGGYAKDNDISQYANHHPDQHNLIFDPNNPLKAYSTHDGGISVTSDIAAADVVWETKEQGYNVTQFYTVSLHPDADDKKIAGGTQDNGTPFFNYNLTANHGASEDASSGDGSFVYLGKNYTITSSQNGFLLRFDYSGNTLNNFSYITPLNAANQLFIHPFAVNPANENFVVYPDENHLWRNNQMITLPRNTDNSDGTSTGWTELTNVTVGNSGHTITALEYSTSSPSGRLYFAGSSDDLSPKIFRLDSPTATDGEVDISIPDADEGSFVHDIAVNPENGNEVIVAISNYEVKSLWYSSNAGTSWTSIGGNLDGETGPSIRAAAFAPTENSGTIIFVGTSIGLFSTSSINGASTVWTQEAGTIIAQSVIAALDYRQSDDVLAVATHGRGLFLGGVGLGVTTEPIRSDGIPESFSLNQNYPNPFNPSTNIDFSIPSNSTVTIKIYDITGKEVASVLDGKSLSSGSYSQTFDASALSSGTYLYRLEAIPSNGGSGFIESKTMTLIK
tara:strand:+ start:1880 stop:4708 length:2829 start_codon:yes stop_codon:yes gene_type:complete